MNESNPNFSNGLNTRVSLLRVVGIVLVVMVAIAIRCFFSLQTDNADIQAFYSFYQVLQNHGNLYVDAPTYDYAPLWSYVLWAVGSVHSYLGLKSISSFHFLVCFVLSLVDVGIATLLVWAYGRRTGLLFLLNPLTILLTGVHSQFDNVAVFFGFAAYLILDRWKTSALSRAWMAAFLLGVSLSFKHLLIFFPVWLFLGECRWKKREGWVLLLVPYGLWIGSFFLLAHDGNAWAGVLRNVFLYAPIAPGWPEAPLMILQNWMGVHFAWTAYAFERFLLTTVLLAMGFWVSRRKNANGWMLYLSAWVGFSPVVSTQYLAIPLMVCAWDHKEKALWAFTFLGLVVLCISPIHLDLVRGCWDVQTTFGLTQLGLWAAQICLAVYVVRKLIRPERV